MLNKLIYLMAKVFKKSRLVASYRSHINKNAKIESGTSFYCSEINSYSFCGYDCDIFHADIGKYTSIASQVVIGGARHPMEWAGMSPVFYAGRDSFKMKFSSHALAAPKRTKVGNDVWIGRSAIIMSGLTIGNGSVIGAGSVVTRDVPPYAIVAGNPARVLRYRFDESTINEFEALQWWDLDEDYLKNISIDVRDPKAFLKSIKSLVINSKISYPDTSK